MSTEKIDIPYAEPVEDYPYAELVEHPYAEPVVCLPKTLGVSGTVRFLETTCVQWGTTGVIGVTSYPVIGQTVVMCGSWDGLEKKGD